MAKNEKPKFEALMTRLEKIVSSLESGSADLDESLALYEEGIGLVRACGKQLDAAEKKIKILQSGEGGELTETDFEVKNDE